MLSRFSKMTLTLKIEIFLLLFANCALLGTNKQGDSKSDVLLCFDTKFESLVYNKLFESDIDIKKMFYLTSPGKTGRVV